MSLESQIMSEMKTAMKEKDKVALDSLRAIKAQILLIKTNGKNEEVSPEEEIKILQRMVKQRKDSSEQYIAQGRKDLADVEDAQLKVIEKFLPKQLSAEELKTEIENIIREVGAEGKKDIGKVMGAASKKLAGKADGKSISDVVKSLLN